MTSKKVLYIHFNTCIFQSKSQMFAREGELTVTFTSHLMQMRFLSNRPVLSTQLNLLFVKHPDVLGFFWVPFASVSRLQHIFYTVWFDEVLRKQS